ncbi:MAG: hypothetical protein DRI61_00280 [Chloroflexi bacterium]|nr:MAG: hypothetical protein DRI61_00280 [Chloroflexota bacterium]
MLEELLLIITFENWVLTQYRLLLVFTQKGPLELLLKLKIALLIVLLMTLICLVCHKMMQLCHFKWLNYILE